MELLVALTLGVIVGAVAGSSLVRQQRFHRGAGDILGVRERVRDASDLLIADLRATSVPGDTIRLATDTAVELFTLIGASTLCATPSGTGLSLPPDTLASGNTVTAWLTTPDTGDDVLVFHDSTSLTPARGWERLRVTNVTARATSSVCPPSSGLTSAADVTAGAKGYQVTVAPAPSSAVRSGAPVRFVRRGRYSIYQASDHHWYLGYRRCGSVTGRCGTVQPVSGPYQGYLGSSTPPLSFRYYARDDSELTPTGPTTAVARIDLEARGASQQSLHIPGFPDTAFRDSAGTSIAFRNHQ